MASTSSTLSRKGLGMCVRRNDSDCGMNFTGVQLKDPTKAMKVTELTKVKGKAQPIMKVVSL